MRDLNLSELTAVSGGDGESVVDAAAVAIAVGLIAVVAPSAVVAAIGIAINEVD